MSKGNDFMGERSTNHTWNNGNLNSLFLQEIHFFPTTAKYLKDTYIIHDTFNFNSQQEFELIIDNNTQQLFLFLLELQQQQHTDWKTWLK